MMPSGAHNVHYVGWYQGAKIALPYGVDVRIDDHIVRRDQRGLHVLPVAAKKLQCSPDWEPDVVGRQQLDEDEHCYHWQCGCGVGSTLPIFDPDGEAAARGEFLAHKYGVTPVSCTPPLPPVRKRQFWHTPTRARVATTTLVLWFLASMAFPLVGPYINLALDGVALLFWGSCFAADVRDLWSYSRTRYHIRQERAEREHAEFTALSDYVTMHTLQLIEQTQTEMLMRRERHE